MSRLILVHGFTQTSKSWEPVVSRLGTTHEVIALDAPGHGAKADVRAGLQDGADALGAEAGAGIWIGYSMGARFCLHLALHRQPLVEGLVLLGATAGIDDEGERAARRAADEALATRLETVGVPAFLDEWLAQPLFLGLSPDAQGRADRSTNTAVGLASSLRLAGTGTQVPLWDRLAELRMPVLVLAGERDEKFSAIGRRLAGAIGANAEFAVVPDAGHAAHLERPDEFSTIVLEWLAAHGR